MQQKQSSRKRNSNTWIPAGLAAAMIASAGQAENVKSSGPGVQEAQAEVALLDEVRATFIAEDDGAPAKVDPPAPARPERVAAKWDLPVPRIPAALKAKALPEYYVYEGQPVVMRVDTRRIAVRHAAAVEAGAAGDGAVLNAARAAGLPAFKAEPVIDGWRFVEFTQPLADAVAVNAAIEMLLADPGVEFASPVFDNPAVEGGWMVMTPNINLRVREANVPIALDAVKMAAAGADVIESDLAGLIGAFQVRPNLRNGFDLLREANRLAEDPRLAWAEPEMLQTMDLHYTSSDPGWSSGGTWGWDNDGGTGAVADVDTDADLAFDLTRGNPAVRILVMDTGTQQNHPDLNQLTGRDFTNGVASGFGDGNPLLACDDHGTAVAGIITGRIANGLGGFGVCPNARVVAARIASQATNPCSSSFGVFSQTWVANALNWGAAQGCRISNSSFGCGATNTMTNAYANTAANGMLHFASAGNGGGDGIGDATLGYPSSITEVNAVAAIGPNGVRTSFSNFGSGLQFACPGTGVHTTDRTGGIGYGSGDYITGFGGTSAASPFCAGIAAMIWSAYPDMWPASVLSLMKTSAMDLGASGYDTGYGWGFPNVNFALRFPGPNHNWCDEAVTINASAYNPTPYTVTGASEVPDELQESCELNNVGVSHSVWYRFIPDCTGTIDVNTNGSNYDTVLSVFRGSCGNAVQVACDDDSGEATRSQITALNVTAGVTYYIKVSAYGLNNAGGTLDFNFAYSPNPPINDSCGDATTILFLPYTGIRCTLGANSGLCEDADCEFNDAGTSKSVWWEYTPSVTCWADIDTNGSDYDTVLNVRSRCPSAILNPGGSGVICLTGPNIACDDDSGTGVQSMLTNVPMKKGTTYKIRVAAYSNNAGGSATLHFNASPCVADHNASGAVSVQDIFDFLNDYFSANPAADVNNQGGVSVQDIFDYLSHYFGDACS